MSESKKSVPAGEKLGRYDLVALARDWMDAVKDNEEYRGIGQSEMVKLAIDEVRAGNVTQDLVEKLVAAKKKAAVPEESEPKKTEKTEKGDK